jgi:hypothetical protein
MPSFLVKGRSQTCPPVGGTRLVRKHLFFDGYFRAAISTAGGAQSNGNDVGQSRRGIFKDAVILFIFQECLQILAEQETWPRPFSRT